jgi:hypothetical protein
MHEPAAPQSLVNNNVILELGRCVLQKAFLAVKYIFRNNWQTVAL